MWIECGIINYKLIIPMMYPIFHQLRIFMHKDDEKYFLDLFTNFLGFLFGGLVYLFIQWRMKKRIVISDEDTNDNNTETIILELNDSLMPDLDESNEIRMSNFKKVKAQKILKKKETEKKIDPKKEKEEKKKSIKKHLYILALAIIYLIPMILNVCNTYSFRIGSSVSLLFTIIAYVIFGRLILGMKIYSHQIFSLIIILVSNLTIILLVFIGKQNENIFLSLLFIFAIVVLFCLYNNLVKRYFNVYMGSPYYLMFIIGAMSTCLILIYEIITVIAFGKDTNFNGIFYQMEKNFENTKLYPLIFIADVLSAFLWIAGIILTIYFFTPCHFIICESISQILSSFISQPLGDLSTERQVIIYILFVVIFLGSLIYNEIFIINICSLSKNTQKHISQRQKEETENIISNNILLS